ncbi:MULTISPECIES: HD family phosphohydrolase [unclassified Polaribacter]|jgi:putative nucleotidyltransferase with HDIG domain|uniref:HD family phosphohydrolase n=1 Tax=unclassified Polaribacter TaxID=196858 RepID=UPI001C5024B7|nr:MULTISPECIES: HDIG domain-containing metalloprotein [unclassified Polaribacter]QXP64729.1 HDIG domain-containing protein [Polaribacter sp. HaHaR_3_91]QXP67227.1 HDIG domain-containing protein [Polaribacter sp. AHE13PA]QXP69359.1 HDIG domain-containing protein [Polaribacter sp. R2A056_3_33]
MSNIVNKLYQNNAIIYKVILFLVATIAIVYLFPKGGQFKYDFNNGQLWKYDNLYAPFDFSIQKTAEEIALEKKQISENSKVYFLQDFDVEKSVKSNYKRRISLLKQSDSLSSDEIVNISKIGQNVIDNIYKRGFLEVVSQEKVSNKNEIVALRKGNEVEDILFKNLLTSKEVLEIIRSNLEAERSFYGKKILLDLLSEIIKPNIYLDTIYTDKVNENAIKNISYTKGIVEAGKLIILKGDIVEGKKLAILNSLKTESESQVWTDSNYNWIILGYTILVSLALLMLLLFLKKYRVEIYDNNNQVTFIFFNVFLMIFIQTLVIKYNADYLYVVPLSVLPIVLKAFFDARLGLFTHVLTVLLLGYIVPNSFEFIYLHIIAGMVTILTVSELYKRGNLFISVAQITLIYMVTYFAFSIIKEGNASQINWNYFMLFAANGLLSFLSIIIIYMYEKVFGLVSDITLLELSNTNAKLLRELNEKAPGTFQHSMQVANLAEAAANEIGANSMLVRTGALYHDIGKILNPMYFTENQSTGVNPHNDLSARDSSKIITDHVIKGVELAKKYKLPDRIIDFIRTHHGTSSTYYFYKKEQELNPDTKVDIKKFQYQGPIPFSKETAILMMCDASEAASKSLTKPTALSISNLIDKIISKQMADNQFLNSNITFREIEIIKKVIKKKLMNIYHLRVEYPE